MSADYDTIMEFFDQMKSFLDRITMTEGNSPKLGPFQRCVMHVFTSMLTICGIAVDYAKKELFSKLKASTTGGFVVWL